MFENRQALFDSKELFSTKETEFLLGVCSKTLANWADSGLLECRRAKTKRYYPKAAIQRFLMQQQSITPPEIALEGTTKELVRHARLVLLELRRRPDFNMEMIADVIAK